MCYFSSFCFSITPRTSINSCPYSLCFHIVIFVLLQRSLISYKSKMVMRSIPELLNDSSSHISIAVARHLKESSPLPSSSSDSDEDIDELPFIPMPLHMEFSGSRMSLNEIQTNEQKSGKQDGTGKWSGSPTQVQEEMECDSQELAKNGAEMGKVRIRKRSSVEDDRGSSDEETPSELVKKTEVTRKPLRRGSSMESDKPEIGRRRGELRRGGSADSALMLRITPEEGAGEESQEDGQRVLKKAVSMELPRRSTSPGTVKMSQEDYALKLELMRQRLLRGASVDNKMSGLRGPLLETLGMGDEKRTMSSDRYSRSARLGPLTRAASSDSTRDEASNPKVLRKAASFSQGDSEPIALHRRLGAPLEIPLAQVEERKLKEAISMSALTEQIKLDSRPVTPRGPSPKPPTPESVMQESPTKTESEESFIDKEIKQDDNISEKMEGLTTDNNFDERSSTSGFSEKDMSISEEPMMESECTAQRIPTPSPDSHEENMDVDVAGEQEGNGNEEIMKEEEEKNVSVEQSKEEENVSLEKIEDEKEKSFDTTINTSSITRTSMDEYNSLPESDASASVTDSSPSRVVLPDGTSSAYASIMQTIMVPAVPPLCQQHLSPSTVVVQSSSSISGPPKTSLVTSLPASVSSVSSGPSTNSTTEHPAVYSRVASPETIMKEPSPSRTTTHSLSQQDLSVSANIEDITSEELFETRFKKRESSLSRSLKFLSRSKNGGKPQTMSSDDKEAAEEMYRPGPVGAPLELSHRRLEEKSKSVQDLREAQKDQGFMRRLSLRLKRTPSTERKEETPKEEDSAPSRRRLSWTLGRRGSQDKKELEMMHMDGGGSLREKDDKESRKPNESPVLAMRRKIESTVAGISTRIRSYSEERRSSEDKEPKRTPIFSMIRRATSENRGMKAPSLPQNQLAAQTSNGASSESLDSVSSKVEPSQGTKQIIRSPRSIPMINTCNWLDIFVIKARRLNADPAGTDGA